VRGFVREAGHAPAGGYTDARRLFRARRNGLECGVGGDDGLKRFAIALLCGIGGYIVVAVASYFLIFELSSNRHDRDVEAAMTSVFFFGPM